MPFVQIGFRLRVPEAGRRLVSATEAGRSAVGWVGGWVGGWVAGWLAGWVAG